VEQQLAQQLQEVQQQLQLKRVSAQVAGSCCVPRQTWRHLDAGPACD
jgi:hypothetical protein